ncbi:MAG TPA: SGNH/GDSL hydrolase family protein, partial [Luteolibacter sp.]|nr:SGNH/GDSL hydrolase family protein [Luteolibacter sp.]
ILCFAIVFSSLAWAEPIALPAELSAYQLVEAPRVQGLQLRKGDRLAICGDSITEQKMYSVILETYLTACTPELEITCRQYGWSGEQASGFLARMKSDVLRFNPSIATTCYGMNDFRYVPYDEAIATAYRNNLTEISKQFREANCRWIIGSSGIIDSVPHWVKSARGNQQDLNVALSRFRNIAVEVANREKTGFADIYTPMLLADFRAKKDNGPEFKAAGKDGVHPGWAGQVIMAYAFLKAMGLDGDLGGLSWDDSSDKASATGGHEIISCTSGRLRIRSSKLPFSIGEGSTKDDNSIRAGLALVPFDQELNRLTLRVTSPKAKAYKVTWGGESRTYTAKQLTAGIPLATDFIQHPLLPAFQAVWKAVAEKQAYETKQIKSIVHGAKGKADPDAAFAETEPIRAPLAEKVKASLKPVEHEIVITPVD